MKIAILGCGNMGYAYAKSLVKEGLVNKENLFLFEKFNERADFLRNENIGSVFTEYSYSLSEADIIVLAVKPQGFAELANEIKPLLSANQTAISIMAGVKKSIISKQTGLSKVVRAMPNTPCQIGFGITGYYLPEGLSENEQQVIEQVLGSTGKAVTVNNEDLIDAVTAVSGSGPAYFFYIIQQMQQAGAQLGLTEDQAYLLASETMKGAYELMSASDLSLQELINAVTSKGGTTHAALTTFKENQLGETIHKGLKAANDRAGELSKMLE